MTGSTGSVTGIYEKSPTKGCVRVSRTYIYLNICSKVRRSACPVCLLSALKDQCRRTLASRQESPIYIDLLVSSFH